MPSTASSGRCSPPGWPSDRPGGGPQVRHHRFRSGRGVGPLLRRGPLPDPDPLGDELRFVTSPTGCGCTRSPSVRTPAADTDLPGLAVRVDPSGIPNACAAGTTARRGQPTPTPGALRTLCRERRGPGEIRRFGVGCAARPVHNRLVAIGALGDPTIIGALGAAYS